MENFSLKGRLWLQAWIFLLCAGTYFWMMNAHKAVELADDGAFFLRYAQNMKMGHFWVWNLDEAPIWGASAPLFPLFLAGPLLLGFDPVSTVIITGIVAGAIGLAVIAVLLATQVGLIAGSIFFVVTAISSQLTYWVGSGLETPLTVLLLALSLFSVLGTRRAWVLGLAAGLLAIHKLDMIPVAGLVLLAGWVRDRTIPIKAITLAFAVAISWYAFAWWYFGSPIPNSFITKAFHQQYINPIIDWRWFGQFVLLNGIDKLMSACLLGLLWVRKSLRPVLMVFGGLLLTHLLAYTVKHPIEPYDWYAMASVLSLAILAAIAVQSLSQQIHAKNFLRQFFSVLLPVSVLCTAVFYFLPAESAHATAIQRVRAFEEGNRANAGRWVDKNTPSTFVVMAGHGNPSYFSNRRVIDSSFLNRKFDPSNLYETLKPEIFISNGNLKDPEFKAPELKNYQVIKVFDEALSENWTSHYWFAVLARKDVIDQIKNVDFSRVAPDFLMNFVSDIQLGDVHGVVRQEGKNIIFVHPGATSPTRFLFDFEKFSAGRHVVKFEAKISPEVPRDALNRGAAMVRVTLLNKGQLMVDGVVKEGQPLHYPVAIKKDDLWQVVVDPFNGPDTDWILVSFN